jgi:integral membrane protein (TIGR01906 family)
LGLVRSIAALLFITALPVALLTTNIRIAVNEPRVYEYSIDQYDAVATTGIERGELLRAGGELRSYFRKGSDEPLLIRVEQGGQPVALFNQEETTHLRDVKDILQTTFRVQEIAVMFVLAYVVGVFIWAREGTLRTLAAQVLISGALTVALLLVVGIAAALSFDAAWSRFHEVLFTNDLWQLDPDTDRLIQMFPEAFWQDITLWIGVATLAEMGLLAAVAAIYLAVTRSASDRYVFPAGAQPMTR